MAQVGHAKPDTLLRIYAQVMQRDRAKIGSAFDALMAGAALPADPTFGPMGPNTASAASSLTRPRLRKTCRFAATFVKRLMGLEPTTFCMASSAAVVLKRHETPANRPFLDS
jgi:hypothetical protein